MKAKKAWLCYLSYEDGEELDAVLFHNPHYNVGGSHYSKVVPIIYFEVEDD